LTFRYFVLNKPPGCLSVRRDRRGRPTVYDHVPPHFPRLPHVGRLDWSSEGLLLFTDDGRLAQALLNRDFAGRADATGAVLPVEKVYHVKVRGLAGPDDPHLRDMTQPLVYDDGVVTRPARVSWLAARARAAWIEVVVEDGRNRQVRRLCAREGLQVVKLRRVRLGPLDLGALKPRWCRPLAREEIAACYRAALPCDPLPAVAPIDDSRAAYEAARAAPGAAGGDV
jgi:pseudouridine synthase